MACGCRKAGLPITYTYEVVQRDGASAEFGTLDEARAHQRGNGGTLRTLRHRGPVEPAPG